MKEIGHEQRLTVTVSDHTYIYFSINDVYKTSKHYDEIKHIPRISKIILSRETGIVKQFVVKAKAEREKKRRDHKTRG